MCEYPCHLVNITSHLNRSFDNASANLKHDGLNHYLIVAEEREIHHQPLEVGTKFQALEITRQFMMIFNHRLFRGSIYRKPKNGK